MVRIAQGLVHMGKGTMTINPFHSDNQVSYWSETVYDLVVDSSQLVKL